MFLVLDMINDIVNADGPAGKSPLADQVRERNVVGNMASAISNARAAGRSIGYVRVGFSPDYKECPANSPVFGRHRENGFIKLGTWGTEVHPDLAPRPEDYDIVKQRVSPFYATNLELILKVTGAKTLIVGGVSTNAVVQGAVRDGHDRDFHIIVLEDCCCAFTKDEHEAAISGLTPFAEITTSDACDFSV